MKRLILLATLLWSVTVTCPTLAQTPTLEDVAYGDHERQVFDLYRPDKSEAAPLVLFIHGGRWMRNDKSQVHRHERARRLTEAGFAVAAINYRYSTQAIWPAQLDDTHAALDYLSAHADEMGLDMRRVAVWGQSSGAHMTLMTGLTHAPRVQAIVSWYAPSDLYRMAEDREIDDVPGGNEGMSEPTPESLLIGAPVPQNKALADAASPVPYIAAMDNAADLPPMLLMHGTADTVVSPLQSERLFTLLREQGADVSLLRVEGAGHGGDAFDAKVETVLDFLADALAPTSR